MGTRLLRGIAAACLAAVLEGACALTLRGREISSLWELNHGIVYLAPIALPLAALGGLLGSVLLGWLEAADARRGAVWALGVATTLGAGAAAWAVGGGRHLSGIAHRLGLAALVGFGLGWVALWGSPRLAGWVRRRPRSAGVVAALCLLTLELVNRFVLVRLYPGFHASLAIAVIVLAPSLAWLVPSTDAPSAVTTPGKLGILACFVTVAALALAAPAAARALARFDNFRLILLENAPLLGQAVKIAARLAPPPPLVACEGEGWDESCGPPDRGTRRSGPSFSLRDNDILLVTVDALRADHVGAYGYARPTTPNIDRLAAQGVRFEYAYAPTPHTSYSVTSLMTGKYMRPLLLQGAGADSDTWASLLRRYGYRTAAFYPPAVFFIDPQRFEPFRASFLGFEYRKVEFLEGPARARQVIDYVRKEPSGRRLFVWVHLFGPHEPYEAHEGFDFGARDIDRYDSEIAYADAAIGDITQAFLEARPRTMVIISADHGEEFGDHGGRYHGSSVYEEQVRVPLIVRAPQLFEARTVKAPVQTIDLLPTVLTALDVPVPPRMRGRNIGPLLLGGAEPGLALAETEEQVLLAQDHFRLICARQIGACQLFDIDADPLEQHDTSSALHERFEGMRRRERELCASHGQYEAQGLRAEGKGWPSAIVRGIAGDGDAVDEIASLLDDADTTIRRKAAELLFELDRPSIAPALRLALTRDEDSMVRAWCALSLTRLGEGAPLVYDLLAGKDVKMSRLAALALADAGDPRGIERLVAWWRDAGARNYRRSRWLLAAFARLRAKGAVPALVSSLSDVRLRPEIAETLADIGDDGARGPLVRAFAEERYQNARLALAKSLVKLGAREELARPLLRFLGVPDPIPGGLGLAMQAKVLQYVGGPEGRELATLAHRAGLGTRVRLVIPRGFGNQSLGLRCFVRVTNQGSGPGQVRLLPADDGSMQSKSSVSLTLRNFNTNRLAPLVFVVPEGAKSVEQYREVPGTFRWAPGHSIAVDVLATSGVAVEALAVVPVTAELPPPPPEPWTQQPDKASE